MACIPYGPKKGDRSRGACLGVTMRYDARRCIHAIILYTCLDECQDCERGVRRGDNSREEAHWSS